MSLVSEEICRTLPVLSLWFKGSCSGGQPIYRTVPVLLCDQDLCFTFLSLVIFLRFNLLATHVSFPPMRSTVVVVFVASFCVLVKNLLD